MIKVNIGDNKMNLNEQILVQPLLEEMSREKLPEGVLCRISYPICDIGQKNANGRVYEADVWDKVQADKSLQDKLEHRALFGHAEHPEQTQSNLEKTSHVIFEMWTKDGQVWQKFDVLDTPTGRIVDTLLRAGCRVGCSTRASGDLEEAEDDDGNSYSRVVAGSYDYVTTDCTADPSTFGSIPYDVKRNIVTEVKKLFESKEADEGEKEFGTCVLESMTCKDKDKCQKCGTCKVLEEKKLSAKTGEQKTVESLIKDGTIKEGTPVLLQYAQDDIKEAKVEKIEEVALSLAVGVERPVVVNVHGEAHASIGPDGLISILPVETVEGMPTPSVPEQAPEELSPCPDEGESAVEVGSTVEFDEIGEGKLGVLLTGADIGQGERKPKYFDTEEDAKEYADRMNKQLSAGEKSHYKLKYKTVEGKVTKIEESGITIVLDDGTRVNIEDPSSVNIAVISPPPAEEIQPIMPPEEEIEDMEAARSLPGDEHQHGFESKTNEQKLSADDVKKLFKSIDSAFAKHLTGLYGTKRQVALKGKEVGLELSAEGKEVLGESKIGESAELSAGNLIQDKDGVEWIVKDSGDGGLTITQPGEPGTEKVVAWKDVDGYGFKKLSETVEEGLQNWIQRCTECNWKETNSDVQKCPECGASTESDWKFESKIDEDSSRKEFLSRQVKKLKKAKTDFEKENQRKLNRVEKELKALEAEGSGIKEASSVEKDDGWYVESPNGAILGGPYKSKIDADKRKKDVEFYSASKESKVDEENDEPGLEPKCPWCGSLDVITSDPKHIADYYCNICSKFFDREQIAQFESKVDETADIKAMYKTAKLPAPDGKGIHTKAFHELVINVAKGYVKGGDTPKQALDKAYPTAMKQLGKEKAVKKPHQKNESKIEEAIKVGDDVEIMDLEGNTTVVPASKVTDVDEALGADGKMYVVIQTEKGDDMNFSEEKYQLVKISITGESKIEEGLEKHVQEILDAAGIPHQDWQWEGGPDESRLEVKDRETARIVMKALDDSGEIGETSYDAATNIISFAEFKRESISTTAKEIKHLRVEEAVTRAERDKAIELITEITDEKIQLEETSRKEKAFEAKILINKIEKTLGIKERELDAVRAKLEQKAKLVADLNGQLKEQKNLVTKAQEQWEDVVVAATDRVNDMKDSAIVAKDGYQKNLSEAKDRYQKKLDVLVKANETELEKVKKEIEKQVTEKVRKEFVECFVGFKLSETNLVVDDNSRALLEKCKSLIEVEELLEKIVDAGRRGALHSESIKSVYISETKNEDPELLEAERRVCDALKGMNSTSV